MSDATERPADRPPTPGRRRAPRTSRRRRPAAAPPTASRPAPPPRSCASSPTPSPTSSPASSSPARSAAWPRRAPSAADQPGQGGRRAGHRAQPRRLRPPRRRRRRTARRLPLRRREPGAPLDPRRPGEAASRQRPPRDDPRDDDGTTGTESDRSRLTPGPEGPWIRRRTHRPGLRRADPPSGTVGPSGVRPKTEGHMGLTIGVDIGGTKIAAGVVDEEGTILGHAQGADSADRRRHRRRDRAAVSGARRRAPDRGRRHRRRRIRRRQAGHGPLRAEHRLAPRTAQGQGRAARRPAGRRGERRQRRGLGRVQVRRRPGPRRRHLHHPRHRPRRRHHHRQQAAPRTLRRGRRVRPHPGRPRRPAVRLRQPGLLGAVRLRPRPRPLREAARQRHPRERARSCWGSATAPPTASRAGTSARPPARATRSPSTPSANWPAGPARAWPTSPRSSTRPPSSSAAASRTRASWSSTRSASPSAAGWSAASGARTPRCSPPSSAARPAWSARPTWPARADPHQGGLIASRAFARRHPPARGAADGSSVVARRIMYRILSPHGDAPLPDSRTEPDGSAVIRVLSYNIRSMRDDRAALARVIRACAPDLVLVQEAPRFFRWRKRAARLARRTGLVTSPAAPPPRAR